MSLSFVAAASEAGSRVAVVDAAGVAHTFAELAPRVAAVAAQLERRLPQLVGESGPRVAVVAARTLEVLVTLWALLERGLPFVLLHPRAPAAERRRLLAELDCPLVVDERWRLPPPGSPLAIGAPRGDERLCAVVFTSGTTGRPKAALLSRRALVAAAQASEANLGWCEDDRWLLCMPLSHVGGLSIVLRCLIARRPVVLAPEGRFAARALAEQVVRDRVTLVSLVPTMLWRLLELDPPWRAPAQLRAILLGGAPANRPLLGRAADAGLPVLTTYGLTEACSQVTTQPLGTVNRGQLGVGFPVSGVELRLVGSGLPAEGTIEIRGATLFSGYLGGDDPDPFTADGWLRTGDVGTLDEAGALHVLGRHDEMIISGGENVHPLAVEEILEGHPAIVRACVFGVDDDEWGEVVAAALLPAAAGPVPPGELRGFLADRLAPHQCPRLLCWVDALVQTPAGKLDRRANRDRCTPRLRPLATNAHSEASPEGRVEP